MNALTKPQARALERIERFGAVQSYLNKDKFVAFYKGATLHLNPRTVRVLARKQLIFPSYSGKWGKQSYDLIVSPSGRKALSE